MQCTCVCILWELQCQYPCIVHYVCTVFIRLFPGAPGSGKTAIAAHMAKQSDFPFLKICAPKSMIGYHEAAKVQAIKKVAVLICSVDMYVCLSVLLY